MIALCPTCHDAVHHGSLPITDDTLYGWKSLRLDPTVRRGHLYVEPGPPPKILMGSLAVMSDSGSTVFELSPSNRVAFAVKDKQILLLSLTLSSQEGDPVLSVTDSHITFSQSQDVRVRTIPGRFDVFVPRSDRYLPNWALQAMLRRDDTFGIGGRLKVLGLKVLEPGLVRLEGIWASENSAVVVTDAALHFLTPNRPTPTTLVGDGAASVLKFTGPGTAAMFGFAS